MNFQEFPWVVNLSLVFTELPLLERPAAAKAAGFDRVEYWWPFGMTGRPERGEIDAFVSAIEQSGVELVAMNLFAGDMPVGERGVLSHPQRIEEFRDSVDIVMEVGGRLGTKLFNAPYGHRRPGLDHGEQDALATENLAYAANAAGRIGGVILMEPVSGMPEYLVKTAKDAVGSIDRVTAATGDKNRGFLFDQYHITNAGGLVTGKYRFDQQSDSGRFGSARIAGLYRDRYWENRLFESVESLRKIAAAAGISLLELALRWTQSRPVVNAVLLGASTGAQLQSNVDAIRKGPLEREALDEIDEIDEIDAVGAALRGPMPAYNR